jgi:hypothetical protein
MSKFFPIEIINEILEYLVDCDNYNNIITLNKEINKYSTKSLRKIIENMEISYIIKFFHDYSFQFEFAIFKIKIKKRRSVTYYLKNIDTDLRYDYDKISEEKYEKYRMDLLDISNLYNEFAYFVSFYELIRHLESNPDDDICIFNDITEDLYEVYEDVD